ncbi:uncharacterized protein FFNC_15706 [Fusarium fujikuroi]|nr:uncharacterized protein FFNC_15706 [Fusarium fujikuroi]
MPFYYTLVPI